VPGARIVCFVRIDSDKKVRLNLRDLAITGTVILSLVMVGCIRTPSALPTTEVNLSEGQNQIGVANVDRMVEISQVTGVVGNEVAAVAFAADQGNLLAVYNGTGGLYEWRIANQQIVRQFSVGAVGLGGVALDADARRLAVSAGAEWINHLDDEAYLGGQLWSIETGELLDEAGKYYNSTVTRTYFSDIQLTPDGSWALTIVTSAYPELRGLNTFFSFDLDSHKTGEGYTDLRRHPGEDNFNVIAMDGQGEYFAAADDTGQLAVFRFEPPAYPKEPALVLRPPDASTAPPLALGFDPGRHWLAAVRGTELTIWDLQAPSNGEKVLAALTGTPGLSAALAFSPRGDVLAVGTASGLELWDVQNGSPLIQVTDNGVYAVAFDDKGQRLAWGDAEGTVHVWALPDGRP
jgi:hypothetical protein